VFQTLFIALVDESWLCSSFMVRRYPSHGRAIQVDRS